MPKTKKKNIRTVEIKNDRGETVVVTQQFDVEAFKQIFTQWKNECKSTTAEKLLVKGIDSKNLFEFIKKHGIHHRPQAKKPVSEEDGIGQLLEDMNDIIKGKGLLTPAFKKDVEDTLKQLKDIEDSDADPRNIPFTIPIYRRVNKKTAAYDKKKHTKRWYGHYRVPDYTKYRNLKAKIFDNKEYAESLDNVPKDWSKTEENSSKPPMWQALFSTKEDKSEEPVINFGLKAVLIEALKMTRGGGGDINHIKLKLRGVARGGLAKELYSITDISEQILQFLGDAENLGQGVNPKTGNIRDDYIQRLFETKLSFKADGPAESNKIKDVYGVDKLVLGQVKGYSLNITRGMVKNLFMLTGKCERRSRKGPVYIKGYEPPTQKMDKGVNKSWKQILGSIY